MFGPMGMKTKMNSAYAHVTLTGTQIDDDGVDRLVDWFVRREIHVIVLKLPGCKVSRLDHIIRYMREAERFVDRSTEQNPSDGKSRPVLSELHLQKNYLTHDAIADLVGFLCENFDACPRRSDIRYRKDMKYKHHTLPDYSCPIWIRLGFNDSVRADPWGIAKRLRDVGKVNGKHICWGVNEQCTHHSCAKMSNKVCPFLHIQGVGDEMNGYPGNGYEYYRQLKESGLDMSTITPPFPNDDTIGDDLVSPRASGVAEAASATTASTLPEKQMLRTPLRSGWVPPVPTEAQIAEVESDFTRGNSAGESYNKGSEPYDPTALPEPAHSAVLQDEEKLEAQRSAEPAMYDPTALPEPDNVAPDNEEDTVGNQSVSPSKLDDGSTVHYDNAMKEIMG